MTDAYILDAVRTPCGKNGGHLAEVRGDAGILASEIAAELPATLEALRERAIAAQEEPEPGADLAIHFPEP